MNINLCEFKYLGFHELQNTDDMAVSECQFQQMHMQGRSDAS